MYHLDMMNWNSDRTTVAKAVFRERLSDTIQKEQWIIDGNYGSTIEMRLQACDTVFFLDYPVQVCLEGVKARRGKERTDMPWVESEDKIDEEFIEFIKNYNDVSRPAVMQLLKKYSDKSVFIFKNRDEATKFLDGMQ